MALALDLPPMSATPTESTVLDALKSVVDPLTGTDFVAGKLSTAFMERYIVEKKPAASKLAETA